jgi:hypothetical protein
MPWDSCYKAAADNVEFWDKELKELALLFSRRASGPSHDSRQEFGHTKDRSRSRGERNDNGGGRDRRGKGSSIKVGLKEQASRDGRNIQGRCGTQICFEWSRQEGGCANECPSARLHVCEFCLQPHRTVSCPQHPGWTPPSKGIGKGKSRDKARHY